MLFEVFTETNDESNALEQTLNFITDSKYIIKQTVKKIARTVLGNDRIEVIKKLKK